MHGLRCSESLAGWTRLLDEWIVGLPRSAARSDAAQALGQLGRADEAVAAGLLGLVGDPQVDAGVRRYAAQALRQLLDS